MVKIIFVCVETVYIGIVYYLSVIVNDVQAYCELFYCVLNDASGNGIIDVNLKRGGISVYRNILFDLDGTLTDPGIGITASVSHALVRFGITPPHKSELYKFIGPPLGESLMKYFGMTKEESVLAIEYYREYFRVKGIFENEVYSGIPEMLKYLRDSGCRLLVATSKPEVFAVKILEHFGLAEYFDVIAGADLEGKRGAKADVIRDALGRAGIKELSECIMVGDRLHDIEGAEQAGICSVGVLWGYGSRAELTAAGAKYIAENIGDIPMIVL